MPYKDDLNAALAQNEALRKKLENKEDRPRIVIHKKVLNWFIENNLHFPIIIVLLVLVAVLGAIKCDRYFDSFDEQDKAKRLRMKNIRNNACSNVCKKEHKQFVSVEVEVEKSYISCKCILPKGVDIINVKDPLGHN